MKRICTTLGVALLVVTEGFASAPQTATLSKAHILNDAGGAELPALTAGQHVVCVGQTDHGYSIVCRDRHGLQRYALLPFRDSWGRVTGRAWTSNALLEPYTLEVMLPVALVPSALVIPAGTKADVLAEANGTATLEWNCGEETIVFQAPTSIIQLGEKDALTDAQLLEETLQTELAQRSARSKKLREEVDQAERHIATVNSLIAELTATTLSNAELEGRRTVAHNVAEALAAIAPTLDKAQHTRASKLRAEVERQAWPARQEAQVHQERVALAAARDRLILAQAELQQIRMQATTEKAALDAVKAAPTEDKQTDKVLKEAAAVHLQLAKMVEGGEQGSAYTDKLLDVLEAIQMSNEALLTRLQDHTADRATQKQELAAISTQLQQLQKALSGGDSGTLKAPPTQPAAPAAMPRAPQTRTKRPRPAPTDVPGPNKK